MSRAIRARRERMLRVRASDDEIDRWRSLASAAGLSMSELARRSLGRVRAWTPERREAERERTRQLARIGVNLNQVARWANTWKPAAEAVQVVARLVAIERELRRLDGDGPKC